MKQAVFPHRRGGITRSFLLSYLLILLIPMTVFLLSNNKAIGTITENAASYHLSMLDQARSTLEMQLEEAQRMAMQIARDSTVNGYLYSLEKEQASPYQVWEVQKKLTEYLATNQYASQVYVCALKDRTIISSSYYHKDSVESTHMTINGSRNVMLSPLFAFSLGTAEPVEVADDKIKSSGTILFVRTFPDGVVDAAYGNIGIVFDQDQLQQLLSFSNEWTGGFNLILDQNNRVLAADGKDPERISDVTAAFDQEQDSFSLKLGGEEMFLTYLKSPEYGWTYLSVYPQKQVLAETISTRRLLLLSMAAAGAVGLLAAALLARRNARPIHKVMESLPVPDGQGPAQANEYSVIQSAVDHLVAENRDLTIHSAGQKQMVRDAFFRVLMSRQFADSQLVRKMSKELGVDMERCAFIGVQFAFERLSGGESGEYFQAEDTFSDAVCQLFAAQFGAERCAFFPGADGQLVLLCFPAEQRLEIYARIQGLIQETSEAIARINTGAGEPRRMLLGISNVYTALPDVARCGEEARFSLEYSKMFEFGRPVFYDTISGNVTHCKFTLSDHQHLLNILKSGSTDAAQKIFNDLVQANIIDNKINVLTGEQLFYAIKGVLIEGMDFIGDEGLREKIRLAKFQEDDVFGAFLALEDFYISVTSEIGRKKENRGSILVAEVQDYLRRDYADAGISVATVAAKFSISEAYLSRLFREVAKTTFAAWLENFRLDKAKELLSGRKYTMVEIAGATGYNSVESFRRAFKRAVGMTPSEYQESLEKNR